MLFLLWLLRLFFHWFSFYGSRKQCLFDSAGELKGVVALNKIMVCLIACFQGQNYAVGILVSRVWFLNRHCSMRCVPAVQWFQSHRFLMHGLTLTITIRNEAISKL